MIQVLDLLLLSHRSLKASSSSSTSSSTSSSFPSSSFFFFSFIYSLVLRLAEFCWYVFKSTNFSSLIATLLSSPFSELFYFCHSIFHLCNFHLFLFYNFYVFAETFCFVSRVFIIACWADTTPVGIGSMLRPLTPVGRGTRAWPSAYMRLGVAWGEVEYQLPTFA